MGPRQWRKGALFYEFLVEDPRAAPGSHFFKEPMDRFVDLGDYAPESRAILQFHVAVALGRSRE